MLLDSDETLKVLRGQRGRGGGFEKRLGDVKLTKAELKRIGDPTPEVFTVELKKLIEDRDSNHKTLEAWEKGSLIPHQKRAEELTKSIEAFKVRLGSLMGTIVVIKSVTNMATKKVKQNMRNLVTKSTKELKAGGWPTEVCRVVAQTACVAEAVPGLLEPPSTTATALFAESSTLAKHVQAVAKTIPSDAFEKAHTEVIKAVAEEVKKATGARGSLHDLPLVSPPKWGDVCKSFADFDERCPGQMFIWCVCVLFGLWFSMPNK